jgi:hypothetical protein
MFKIDLVCAELLIEIQCLSCSEFITLRYLTLVFACVCLVTLSISYTRYLRLGICTCLVLSVQKGLPLRLLRCPVFRHRDHYVKALIANTTPI